MLPHIISVVMAKEIPVSRVILVFARNGMVPIHTVVIFGTIVHASTRPVHRLGILLLSFWFFNFFRFLICNMDINSFF